MTNDPPDAACPLCRGHTEPYNFGRKDLELRRCRSCTIVFFTAADRTSDYAKQMEDKFFSTGFLIRHGAWENLFDRLNAYRTLRRIQSFKSSGRLLEIGVGNGSFLHVAQRAGFECTGIEPSQSIARHVEKEHNLHVFNGYLEEFAESSGQSSFDVIVMNHVLEHMPNPSVALKQVRSLLAFGGIAHVAVPNIDSWEARLPGWTSYEPYHLYYFSPKTLSSIAVENGLEVLTLRTTEPFSGWFNSAVRTVLRKRYHAVRESVESSSIRGSGAWRWFLLSTVVNTGRVLLGFVILPVRFLQARLNKGEELVAVMTIG